MASPARNRGGRPTDYTPSIIPKVQEYLDSCKTSSVRAKNGVRKSVEVRLPSIEGLALFLGINRSTIYAWRPLHPEFSDIIERLLSQQGMELINHGLAGTYNPTIAKVLLTKHGYREGVENVGSDGGPMEATVIMLPEKHKPSE